MRNVHILYESGKVSIIEVRRSGFQVRFRPVSDGKLKEINRFRMYPVDASSRNSCHMPDEAWKMIWRQAYAVWRKIQHKGPAVPKGQLELAL